MKIDKDNIKLILILLVVALGIGYSYLNTNLNINGTANINSANWNVYWNNVQVKSGSVSASAPTISNQTTVTFGVNLEKPGDYYEFTVDAVNAGTIDAMIELINSKLNGTTITTLPTYLEYDVTYSDGTSLEANQELLHDSTETYKVRLAYKDNINASDLPSTNQNLSLQFGVIYKQSNTNSIEVPHPPFIYTRQSYNDENGEIIIGQTMPSGVTQYNNASDLLADLDSEYSFDIIPIYLKHKLDNNIVTESYIEFVVTSEMATNNPGMTAGTYALRGGGATYNSTMGDYENDSPYLENNIQTMVRAFGSNNCDSYVNGTYTESYCNNETFDINVNTNSTGYVGVSSNSWTCSIRANGKSSCGFAA